MYLIRDFLLKKHGISHHTAYTRTLGLTPGRQRDPGRAAQLFSALPFPHDQRRRVNEHGQLSLRPSVPHTEAKGVSETLHVSSIPPPLDLKKVNTIWKTDLESTQEEGGWLGESQQQHPWTCQSLRSPWLQRRCLETIEDHMWLPDWMVDALILFKQRPLRPEMTIQTTILRTRVHAEKQGRGRGRPGEAGHHARPRNSDNLQIR